MSTRLKHVCLVLSAQAGCLAVGLWMQHHYVVSSAVGAAEQQAWSDIEAEAGEVFSLLTMQESDDPGRGDEGGRTEILFVPFVPDDSTRDDEGADGSERIAGRPKGWNPNVGDITVVDLEWRVVSQWNVVKQRFSPGPLRGSLVKWTPRSDAPVEVGRYLRGKVRFPDGEHIAVACGMNDGRGHVLIHKPLAPVAEKAAALFDSLPAVSIITFIWICALLNIAVYVILARIHDQIDRERSRSASDALRKTQNVLRMRDAVIFGLAKLAESRDPQTGDHLERISVYSTYLSSALRRHPKFRNEVTPAFVRLIGISSALHDIGKVGVEDRILLKPGPLTPKEQAIMQTHSTIGGECLQEIEQRLGGSNFLQMARQIAFSHHEKWDGTGYPMGLSGTAIPLAARIVAIVDMYDALSTERPYKDPFPHQECMATMRNERGKKLDPDLVDVWLTIESKFRGIAGQYSRGAPDSLTEVPGGLKAPEEVEVEDEDACIVSPGISSGGM